MKEPSFRIKQSYKKTVFTGLERKILQLYYTPQKYSYEIGDIENLLNVSAQEISDSLHNLIENNEITFSTPDDGSPQKFILNTDSLICRILDCLESHSIYTHLLAMTADKRNEEDLERKQLVKSMILFNSEVKDLVEQKMCGYFNQKNETK